jgi:transcriptional regulator with XRE-family HTH domain
MVTMSTIASREELDDLRELINEFIKTTGESVTSIAERAGVKRQFLSQLRSGSYESSPQLENVKRVAAAIGKKMIWIDAA